MKRNPQPGVRTALRNDRNRYTMSHEQRPAADASTHNASTRNASALGNSALGNSALEDCASGDQSFKVCPAARFGVVAMMVALVVTSIMTVTAEAQMPSTTPGPDGATTGTNSSSGAGVVVFAVVLVLIIGGAVVLYLRNRRRTS